MASFNIAHQFTAKWEGGLTDHPSDPGGVTNFGVSLRWLRQLYAEEMKTLKPTAVASGSEQIAKMPGAVELASPRISLGIVADIDGDGDIDADDIRALTLDDAARLFRLKFWEPYKLSGLPQLTATVHYDCVVNTGPKQATLITQRACNSLVSPYGVKLAVDGAFGPKTRDFLTKYANEKLAQAMIDQRKGFYLNLVRDKPNFAPFERGWINRCNALQSFVKGLAS